MIGVSLDLTYDIHILMRRVEMIDKVDIFIGLIVTVLLHSIGFIITLSRKNKFIFLLTYCIIIAVFIYLFNRITLNTILEKTGIIFISLMPVIIFLINMFFVFFLYIQLKNTVKKDMFIMLFPIISFFIILPFYYALGVLNLPLNFSTWLKIPLRLENIIFPAVIIFLYISVKLFKSAWSFMRFILSLCIFSLYIFYNEYIYLFIFVLLLILIGVYAAYIKENKGIKYVIG